jgi:uncharacterized membrane protein
MWRRRLAALTLAASLLWAGAILVAPLALARSAGHPTPLAAVAVVAYLTGARVCHQQAERSFHVAGRPLPVCARCAGLYLMFPMALAVIHGGLRAARPRGAWRRWPLVAAAVPVAASVVVEWITGWSSAPLRAATGAALAIGLAWLVAVALAGVEFREARGQSATLR